MIIAHAVSYTSTVAVNIKMRRNYRSTIEAP